MFQEHLANPWDSSEESKNNCRNPLEENKEADEDNSGKTKN